MYTITIRKSRVKEQVTRQELESRLRVYCDLTKSKLYDYGFHIHGKYRQLHLHAVVRSDAKLFNYYKDGWFHYCTPVIRYSPRITRYIHSDDHDNPYKLEQILIENESNYHYMMT